MYRTYDIRLHTFTFIRTRMQRYECISESRFVHRHKPRNPLIPYIKMRANDVSVMSNIRTKRRGLNEEYDSTQPHAHIVQPGSLHARAKEKMVTLNSSRTHFKWRLIELIIKSRIKKIKKSTKHQKNISPILFSV